MQTLLNGLVMVVRVSSVLLFCFAVLLLPAHPCLAGGVKWQPHVDVTARPGTDRTLGKLDFFIPLLQTDDTLLFTDLRGVIADDPSHEGNFGLGFRRIQRNGAGLIGDWLWGAYAFYDYRHSENNNTFNQGTFGVEVLGEYFDVRGNYYLPENRSYVVDTLQSNIEETELSATQVSVHQETIELQASERALPGFDLEAGARLPLLKNHDLWVYGGYFHFDHADTPVVEGPRFRAEYRWDEPFGWQGSRLSLGGEIQHDDIRGEQSFALIELRIPLGVRDTSLHEPLQGIDRRMTEQIVRDVDIVTFSEDINKPVGSEGGPTGISEVANTAVTDSDGGQVNVYFVRAGGTGDCSQANPCDLATATGHAEYAAGDAIVLLDSGGTILGNIIMEDRQQLVGAGDSGSHILILGSQEKQLALSGLGGRPQLDGGAGVSVTLANDTLVDGLAVTGGLDGVKANSVTNATVRDIDINGVGGNAFNFVDTRGVVTITDSTAINSTGAGLQISGGSAQYTFDNFDISDTNSGRSLDIQNTTGGSMFFNVTSSITNSGGSGILINNIAGDITFNSELTVTGATSDAVTLTNLGTATVSLTNGITVTTTNGKGLVGSGGTLDINTGSIKAINGEAYDIDSMSLDVNFTCLRSVDSPAFYTSVVNSDGVIVTSAGEYINGGGWRTGARPPGLLVGFAIGVPCP